MTASRVMPRPAPARRPAHTHARACLLLACLLIGPAAAQSVTIYRCTDADGNTSVQNQPCAAGSREQVQQMQGVGSTPATQPPPARPGMFVTTSTEDDTAPPRILDSATLRRAPAAQSDSDAATPERPAPPPIFQCTTYDSDRYLAENDTPPPRCIALRTVGLDGNPATGAGQACEVKRDQCVRVPDEQACEAWSRLTREAESRWRFAHPDNVAMRREAYDRLAGIVAGSRCGD